MKYLSADQLQDICTRILDAAGSPPRRVGSRL